MRSKNIQDNNATTLQLPCNYYAAYHRLPLRQRKQATYYCIVEQSSSHPSLNTISSAIIIITLVITIITPHPSTITPSSPLAISHKHNHDSHLITTTILTNP
ncbi:hypothetical protein E2C01_067471 [Portunus trituberculatus]|uniref:Uncharacterized protein n=1 Tax=Portunus trituberculatus TaxID=210409 RepID=A0A5B7HSQ1_PORTR|nr:hypothetical protein [Portunus trituberculatus]